MKIIGTFWTFLDELEVLDDLFLEPIDRTFYKRNTDILSFPSTEMEAMTTSMKYFPFHSYNWYWIFLAIIGPIEKLHLKQLFQWLKSFNEQDPNSYSKVFKESLNEEKFDVVFKKFSLTSKSTQVRKSINFDKNTLTSLF